MESKPIRLHGRVWPTLFSSVLAILSVAQQVLSATYDIGGTVAGDLLHIQLQTNKTAKWDWTRFPNFSGLKAEGLEVRTKPGSQACLPSTGYTDSKILAYLSNFIHPDGVLVLNKDNTIQVFLVDSKKMLEPVLNKSSLVSLPQGAEVLFGRLFTSGYNKTMSFRVYYKQANKLLYFDSLAAASKESTWGLQESVVGLIGTTLNLKRTYSRNDADEYLALVNVVHTTDPAFSAYTKVLRVAQDPKTLLLKETVFDLASGLTDAKISLDGLVSGYFTVLEHTFTSGSSEYNTVSAVFGDSKPDTGSTNLLSCLLSLTDGKVAACSQLMTKDLGPSNSLVRVDSPTSKGNEISARVLIAAEIGEGSSRKVSLRGFTSTTTLVLDPTVPGGFKKADSKLSDVFDQDINQDSSLRVRESVSDFLDFYDVTSGQVEYSIYLGTNSFEPLRAVAVNIYTPNGRTYKYTVGSSNNDRYAERLFVYSDGCWEVYDSRPVYYVKIDTSAPKYKDKQTVSLPMYEWTASGSVTAVTDTVNFPFSQTISKMTSSIKQGVLYWTLGGADLVSVALPTETQLSGPYDTVEPIFKPDEEKTDFKMENFSLNANVIKYYYYNNGAYKQISSTNLFGTLDRVLDLKNGKYYSDCSAFKTTEPVVVCKDAFDAALPDGDILAHTLYGSSIFVAVKGASSDLQQAAFISVQGYLVAQSANKKVSYSVPGNPQQVALTVRSNTLFVMGLAADGLVTASVIDLLKDKVVSSNTFKVPGGKVLSYSDNWGAYGKFIVYTSGYAVPFYAVSSHSALKFTQDEVVAYPALPLTVDTTALSVQDVKFGCNLKTEYDIVSDGSSISWPRRVNGNIGDLVSFSFKLGQTVKINQLLCETARNTFFLVRTEDQRVIKIGTKWNETDLAFGRFSNRTVYDLKVIDPNIKILHTYLHGVESFVLAEIKGVRSVVYLNHPGTEWLLNPDGLRALNKLSFTSETEKNVQFISIPSVFYAPTSKKINLTSQVQTQAANRKDISVKIELPANLSLVNHYWGLDVVAGATDKFKIQNRFTYNKDVTIPDHVVLDARYADTYGAFIVKESNKPYRAASLSVLITGPGQFSTSKQLLLPESEVVSPNKLKILAFSRNFNSKQPEPYQVSYKVVVFIQEDTGKSEVAVLLWINQKWTKYDPLIQLDPHEPRFFKVSNIRAVIQNNVTYVAYLDADRKELRSWTESGLLAQGDSVNSFFKNNVDFFDLVASGEDEVHYITKVYNSTAKDESYPSLQIWRVKTTQNTTMQMFKSSELSILSDTDLSTLGRCIGVKENSKQDFFCVIWGTNRMILSFKFDSVQNKYVFVYRRLFAPYKNLAVEEVHFFNDKYFILQGKRTETTWSDSRRDAYGLLYYPLDVEGVGNMDSIYAAGGIDTRDLLDTFAVGSAGNLKIVPGPDKNTLVLTFDKEPEDKSSSVKLVQVSDTVSATGSGMDLAVASKIEVVLRGETVTVNPVRIGDFLNSIPATPVEKNSKWVMWLFLIAGAIILLVVGILAALYMRRKHLSEDAEYSAIAALGNEQEKTMMEQSRQDNNKKTVELDNQL